MEKKFLGLEGTFREYETIQEKLDKNAARDKKYDLSVMSHEELDKILEGNIGNWEKRRILLTQIGFLRIDIFHECYKRIQLAETRNELDEAVKIMIDYIELVAMRFIQERLHPSLIDRIGNFFSRPKLPDTSKTLEEWKNLLSTWSKHKIAANDQEYKTRVYAKIKEIFITLDMLSFSLKNFPPLATEPAH
jgi:hypothetical protein